MASYKESILFPDKPLYLIHKLYDGTNLARSSQWQSQPKSLPATLQPNGTPGGPSEAKNGRDGPSKAKVRFISYNVQGKQSRRKKEALHKNNITAFSIRKKPAIRQKASQPPQQLKSLDRRLHDQHQVANLHAISSHDMLKLAIPALSDRMPPSLSNHIILYVNYYFHVIATDTYPLSSLLLFNPAKQHWFPHMLADDVWRYIILSFAAGTIANITQNSVNFRDAQSLLNEALQQLNHRMSTGYIQTDETLGAIACLANWSNSWGDQQKSWTHARGLAELVSIRGGLCNINERLRSKMYRGILEIAVDSDNIPNTQFLSDLIEITGVSSRQINAKVATSLPCSCEMSLDLANIFHDISELSGALQNAMMQEPKLNPQYMDSATFGLLQRLLICATQHINACHNAFRICLILYLKSLSCTFERFVSTSTTLVKKLRSYMEVCLVTPTPLTRWKLFMGSLAAADGTPEKSWFISSLAECLSPGMKRDDGQSHFQQELGSVLWIEFLHGQRTSAIWSLLAG